MGFTYIQQRHIGLSSVFIQTKIELFYVGMLDLLQHFLLVMNDC